MPNRLSNHNKLLTNSKNIYRYMLFSILFILALSISLITFIITSLYQNTFLENIKDSENDRLIQTSTSTNFITEYSMDFALKIYFDYNINKVIFFKNPLSEDVRDVLLDLKFRRLSTSYIDSIYLYNNTNETFYISTQKTNTDQRKEDFFDTFIVDLIDNPDYQNKYTIFNGKALFIPRFIYQNSKEKLVYTFIYKINLDRKNEASVIINISPEWFEKILNYNPDSLNKSDSQTTIFAIDNDNQIVIQNNHYPLMENLSNEVWLQNLKNTNTNYGYIIEEIDGKEMLINYYKSDNLQIDWMFISIKDYSIIENRVNRIRKIVILISLSLLVIVIIVESIISKRIYLPINNILHALESTSHGRENFQVTLKNNFFRIFLQRQLPLKIEELRNEFEKYNISLDTNKKFVLILFKISNYSNIIKYANFKAISLLKYNILNDLSTSINQEKYTHEGVVLHGDYMLIISNIISNESSSNSYKHLISILKDHKNIITNKYSVDLTIYYSNIENYYVELPSIYNKVMNMAHKTMFYSNTKDLCLSEFVKNEEQTYHYPEKEVSKLIKLLKKNSDLETIKDLFNYILDDAKKHSYKATKYCITNLLLEINQIIFFLMKYKNASFDFEVDNLLDQLEVLENEVTINDFFNKIFMEINSSQKSLCNTNDILIEKIDKLVDENYSNPLFSISEIADKLNLSAAYVGRLYKKTKYKSLNDHLQEVRIEKAQDYLVNSDKPIQDIATISGFSTSNYFHTVFKKKTGMTPQLYRNTHKL